MLWYTLQASARHNVGQIVRVIAEAIAEPGGNVNSMLDRYFEVDHDADTLPIR